ncbi:MAG: nitrous oxide-stimulated promoter family protein [Bacteroidales bacterium]|nr:nitrous oxide-stimulated promoter family protein [Bacteroidales bacterium]
MQQNKFSWEKDTIQKMISLYCRKKHNTAKGSLCSDCESLYNYALQRIDKCPFGYEKPRCSQCTVHCYKKSQRERIKEVMRFSGPRMLWYFPGTSLKYYYLKFKHLPSGQAG